MTRKTVLITGCSSGFGKLTAKKFQQQGWNVIATMRSPEKEQELNSLDNILLTKLDVTDEESVKEAIALGIKKFGAIDVLVNNAGFGGVAVFEQIQQDNIYNMYETNVFGLMRVCREVLPYMRKQKNGVIINVTSVLGFMAAPTSSIYSSTKFAVEGLSEAMAFEYRNLNIKIKTVAPGSYGTNFIDASDNDMEKGDKEIRAYSEKLRNHLDQMVKQMKLQQEKESDPQEVAVKIFECATTETPIHNVAGDNAEMMLAMKNSMPHQAFLDQVAEMSLPKN